MEKKVMRYIGMLMLAMAMTFAIPVSVMAQEYDNTPVNISKDKVRVDGKICYSHIVLERQTLFSISKAYNVSIDDIYRYNPAVKENGLKKNSILIIPCNDEIPVHETAAEEPESPVVQDNPEEIIHIVKWYEDLDVIAEKYGVTVEAIMKANGLKGRKLTKRQRLVIPLSSDENDKETPGISAAEEPEEVPMVTEENEPAHGNDTTDKAEFLNKEVAVSLLLPLKATGSSSSRNNMDFYSGVLLATYDLAEKGIMTELSVYDVADGNLPVTKERIESSDLVIGPVSSGDIGRLFELAPDATAVISPLDPRAEDLIGSHESMIQVPVPHRLQYEDLAAWLNEDRKQSDKVIVITEKGARQSTAVDLITAAIDSTGISYSPFSYSILEGRNVTEPLITLMTEEGTNRFLIASESEAFVNDVVRNLNVLVHKKYDIVLYAPSRIRSFETIEAENFHNVNMHVSLGYYIDYSDREVMEFIMKYRALFNTEPTQFAFQGYDITSFFIHLYSRYGRNWPSKIGEEEAQMLQSTFDCIKTEGGGYVNTGVRRIIYGNDWTINRMK